MGIDVNNLIIRDMLDYTPAVNTQVTKPYDDGIWACNTGVHAIRLTENKETLQSVYLNAGDRVYFNKIYSVDAAPGDIVKLLRVDW